MSSAVLLPLAGPSDDCQAADARAADLERWLDRLSQLARRMLRCYPHLRRWEETDDVVQEAAIRLCRALAVIEPRTAHEFFGLASLQIRRTLIDLARRHFGPQGRAAHYRSDPDLAEGAAAARGHHAGAEGEEPQSLAEWTAFHEAVDSLPPEQRDVFHVVWYGGATYAEAAELLGIARRTAIRRMNLARLRLAPAVASLAGRGFSSDGQLQHFQSE